MSRFTQDSGVSLELAVRLNEALEGLRNGSIRVIVEDSRIVEIERIETVRFCCPHPLI